MISLKDLGYDQYFRRPLPQEYQQYSAVNYDASIEDGSIIESKIANGSITDAKIKNVSAEKIEASAILVPLDLGQGENGKFIKLDGSEQRFLTNDGITNRIIIGEINV